MSDKFTPALLEQIKQLVPISRLVGEYVVADKAKSSPGDLWSCCAFHAEKTPSFHAEDAKGIYHCFGCGATGDHFQWMQEHQGMTFPQAVEAIADRAGVSLPGTRSEPSSVAPRARYKAPVVDDPYSRYTFSPAPSETPPIEVGKRTPKLRNPKHAGTAKFETTYVPDEATAYFNADGELLGYVLRIDTKTGKITPGIWWMKCEDGWEGWSHGSLPAKRPIDNLRGLMANPDRQVLVVAGERKRRIAEEALGTKVVVVSWMGGDNAVDKTDWKPLEGRRIILWPDHDESGYSGMHEVVKRSKPSQAKWVASYEKDKGADVADLIRDGLDPAAYMKANITETPLVWAMIKQRAAADDVNPEPALSSQPSPEPSAAAQDHKAGTQSVGGSGREAAAAEPNPDWQDALDRTDKGTPTLNSLHNAMMVLQYHQDFEGIYAYNEFAQEIAITRRPPWDPPRRPFKPRLLTEIDIIANTGYMETLGDFKLKPKVQDMVAAIKRVADFNRFNPVIDALEKLEWDGMPRLMGGSVGKRSFKSFAVRYLGAEDTPINAAFVARTLIGAVARVYEPGKKHDTMLVLEGTQGSGKSTSIKILANAIAPDLFTDELSEPGTKDAGLQLQGRWIIEVSELDAFRKSDVATLKAFIAREIDRFRRPYGKFVEAFPRSCIMIGTVNPPESGYLRDPSGARRWWPIRCGEFDLDLLKEDALQVWAEARHMYLQGAHTYLTDEEEEQARIVQQARYEHDPWASMIDDYLSRQDGLKTTVSILELMGPSCINVHNERRTPTHAARIAAHLNMIGWKQIDRGIYRRPLTH